MSDSRSQPPSQDVSERPASSSLQRRLISNAVGGVSRRHAVSGLTIVSLAVTWWIITRFSVVSARTLPSPRVMYDVFHDLILHGYGGVPLRDHLFASLRRCFEGFAIGAGIGLPVGVAIGASQYVSAMFTPILAFLRPIPPIAYFPLMILIFGIGEQPKIILIASAAFFYMVLHVAAGVRGVSRDLILTGRMLGLSRRQVFTSVYLRAASPQIMVGVHVSLILSWAVVVAAELISSNRGIGYMATDSATFFRVSYTYAAVIIIGAVGALLEALVRVVERPLLRWHGR